MFRDPVAVCAPPALLAAFPASSYAFPASTAPPASTISTPSVPQPTAISPVLSAAPSLPIHSRKRQSDAPDPAAASLKCVLPGLKRRRRESPASPTSVVHVADPIVPTPVPEVAAMTSGAATARAATASAGSAKMQSMLRGLQHVAACADGCASPLCVSTRAFVGKVAAHQAAARAKPTHDAARCGACQLWTGIVRAHAAACTAPRCSVPGCASEKAAAAAREQA